jgi:nicotinate-nucleotide adenylyltransferase
LNSPFRINYEIELLGFDSEQAARRIGGLRIGILGGTFDPPHLAHLALAQAGIDHLELDEVIFMPVSKNPLKHKPIASAKQRFAMTEILLENQTRMAVSNLEMVRGGPSYAVDSMAELQAAQPADYWFLIGADALKDLKQWKNPDRLLKLCRLAVAIRPPLIEAEVRARMPEEFKDKIDLIHMEAMDIASFEIRDRLARHKPLGNMIPEPVLEYIRQNDLYRS